MADNVTTPGGEVLAADEVGAVKYPRTKIAFGSDGVATDVSADEPFPVVTSGWTDVFAITPNDSLVVAGSPSAMLVLTSGDLAFQGSSGVTFTIPVVAGDIIPIRPRRVMTASTATVAGIA